MAQQAVSRPNSDVIYRLVLSILWLLAFGWWLGLLAILVAWLLHVSLIGLPAGMWLANRLPNVVLLASRPPTGQCFPVSWQEPLVRTVYFLLVGWWAGLPWLIVSWMFTASFLLIPFVLGLRFGHPALFLLTAPAGGLFLPLGLWMLNRAEAAFTLQGK